MATLNNNQVASMLNEAIKMSTGKEAIDTLDLQGIVDAGNDASVIGSVEQFTKSLINVITKNWFTDSSYRSSYNDPFYEDAEKFGAIMQAISVEVPEVKESSAWQDFGPDTAHGQIDTIGEYKIYLPIVHTQYYGKTVAWELPICITGEQWDTAFDNESEIRSFVAYILMCVDNALVEHLENMNAANRNNFMAEKIAYANSQGATGIHVVNLVEEYVKEIGATDTDYTVEEYLNNSKALLNGTEIIDLYTKYIQRMSVNFNTAGRKRFTPSDRLVLQMLAKFKKRIDTVALSDTFHDSLVSIKGYEEIPYWQGQNTAESNLGFNAVSKIDVKIGSDGTAVEQGGIVAFLCDKWAIMHTVKSKRVAVKHFDPENLSQYYYQFRDQYMNDLTMNAIVFIVEDYKAPESDENVGE